MSKYRRIEEERECLNCGLVWTVINQNVLSDRVVYFCKDCMPILSQWRRKQIIMDKIPGKRELYLKQRRLEHIRRFEKSMLNAAKIRAERDGLDFSITLEDIVIPEMCPILEVPLIKGTKGNYEYSPSLDRIDNLKGYTPDNIQIISKKANSMKNSATLEELQTFCKNILRYSPNNSEDEAIEVKDKEPLR